MSDRTAIEWTDATWNPVTGCTKVSPGCANCYIEKTPPMRLAGRRFVNGEIPVQLHPGRLEMPLKWKQPRRVFVCSMSDLFHEDVPTEFIAQVWLAMHQAPQHTFQVLTKRPGRMQRWVKLWLSDQDGLTSPAGTVKPLANVWLGVSVENQRMADERIPLLLETPAAVRFLSCEPLLGPLDLRLRDTLRCYCGEIKMNCDCPSPDWVIVGGESGPGSAERKLVERHICECMGVLDEHPCDPLHHTGWRPKRGPEAWVIDIRDQCQAAGVPFFFKQWGGPRPKSGGRLLDGREWNEMPQREAVLA
jgi:protein gp37